MIIPDKIKVSGVDYKIEFVKEIKDDLHEAEYRGRTIYKENRILILDSYSTEGKFRTILHEIIHVLDDDYKLEMEENTIRRLTVGLYQVLKDNNLLRE
ncbi:unnamed protein product [marine sediment metagenome]|uniref:IrrE N-terminal-like domain-containing protein n=1 Tax=marine sediment metagenome TaxID=412755 RepID=X1FGM3_9ZZZZ